jgi:hypothetical protein
VFAYNYKFARKEFIGSVVKGEKVEDGFLINSIYAWNSS